MPLIEDNIISEGGLSGDTLFVSTDANIIGSLSAATLSSSTLNTLSILSGGTDLSQIFFNNGLNYIQNIVRVGLSGNVDFTSIKSAVDSITGATINNQWVVQVGAGLFIEDTITMKPYVSIIGAGMMSTTIQVNDPSKNAIVGSRTSAISNCTIQGATNSGSSAIYFSNSSVVNGETYAFIINQCSFGPNNILVHNVGSTATSSIVVTGVIKGSNSGNFIRGFVVENTGSSTTTITIKNSQLIASSATTETIYINGTLAQSIIDSTSISRLGTIAQTAIKVMNGGSVRLIGVDIRLHAKGIVLASGGTAPSISAVAINMSLNTQDVLVEHSGATGYIDGVFDRTISYINPSSTVVLQGLDRKIVRVATLDTDFNSVKEAIESITDASAINRYVISVGPGTFHEDQLTLKPYIDIIGVSNDATFIKANDPNNDFIISTGNTLLNNLKLGGISGTNKSIFVHTGDILGGVFTVVNCNFTETQKILTQTSTNGPSIAVFSECSFDGLSSFKTGFDVSDNGVNPCLNAVGTFSWLANPFLISSFDDFIIANGSLTKCISSNLYVGSDIAIFGGNCLHAKNGAIINMSSAQFHGFDKAIYSENAGVGPSIDVNSVQLVNNNIDLLIEHPDTTGSIQGSADMDKVFIDANSTFNIALQHFQDGSFNISNSLNLRYQDGTVTDVSSLISESSTMGVMEGGELSIVSGFTIGIDEGFGYSEKFPDVNILKRLDWSGTNLTLSANSQNYIFFDTNGLLTSSGARPETVYNILLGRVVTNNTGVSFIDKSPLRAQHIGNELSEFTRDALGPIYVSGSIIVENTASTFTLNITQGNYFFGENNFLPSGGTSVPLITYYRNGIGGYNTSATTIVDSSRYDDGSGTLVPLSGSYYTKHSLYLIDDKYFMVYGQTQYSALTVVEQSDISTPPPTFNDAVVLIGGLVVKQGTISIAEIQDLRPVIGFKAPGVAASSFHGNLLGLDNDDHHQYLLVSGVRAMTGALNLNGNDIISAGTINGVIIQSHSSRHLPNGADALTTGIPVSVGNANIEGIQNAFSRQDHIHAHGIQSGGTSHSLVDAANAGFMSSADKIYFDTIPSVFNTKANLSGATFTGTITAPTMSATTYLNLPFDVRVTGGTTNNTAHTYTFTNNTGGTFTVTGLIDITITGGTYSNGTVTFTNNTGGTFNVTGITNTDTFTTAFTYTNNVLTIARNQGLPVLSVLVNTMTGLTVNGNLTITGSTSSATLSATTYLNLPIDNTITGGTVSRTSNNTTLTFTNNTGGTFTVTPIVDTFITGGTTNNAAKTYTFTNNSGNTFTVNGLTDIFVTGGTTNNTAHTYTFTNSTGGTFTLNGLTDIFVTGGTANNGTKIYTFTNNTGGTFNVTGLTDVAVTGGTVNRTSNNTTLTFTNSTGGTFTVTPIVDTFITGGTYSTGTATFTNNSGNTFNVTGFTANDTFVTGFTYSNNLFTISRNQGQPNLSVLTNTMTGLTVNGSLSATTLSASTVFLNQNQFFKLGDGYVSGGDQGGGNTFLNVTFNGYFDGVAWHIPNTGQTTSLQQYDFTGAITFWQTQSPGATDFQPRINITPTGKVGIGSYGLASAKLHIASSTGGTNNAPFKLTSGVNTPTGEVGAFEFDGEKITVSPTGTTRHNIILNNYGVGGGQTIVGGTANTDTLIFKTTSGSGITGSDMMFKVGVNGATEGMRILNTGRVNINTLSAVTISSTTVSATTYLGNGAALTGIPYVTGGTTNYTAGTITFANSTGGTFVVTGFDKSSAQISMVGNVTTTTIPNTTTYVKAAGTTTAVMLSGFSMSANNRLLYTGSTPTRFIVNVSSSLLCATVNQNLRVIIGKNSATITGTELAITNTSTTGIFGASVSGIVDLITNDFVEVFVRNTTAANAITVNSLIITIHEI